MEEVICFKHEKILNEKELPKGVEKGFQSETAVFYIVKQINLLSPKVLEDDDADMQAEYKRVEQQMAKITQALLSMGLTVISLSDYKIAENKVKEGKNNSFLDNLTENERVVYEKTRNFITEYDIRNPSQKHFITSLRSKIAQGENINEEALNQYATKMNKNLDDLFDFGQQSAICDFIAVLQTELEKNKPTKKKKSLK